MVNRNKLRGLIASKGLNQSELAKEIGLSYNGLNMKMNEKSLFTEKEVKAIADYFEVEVSFLFE